MSSSLSQGRPLPAHPLLRLFGKTYLKLTGWQVIYGDSHKYTRYVAIGAHHTSNWDAPLGLAALGVLNIRARYMIKSEWQRSPLWPLFAMFGGIPIDRTKPNQIVLAMVQAFRENEQMVLLIAPEGTRKATDYWHMGFYHIAVEAGVPVLLGFADYEKKVAGFGKTVFPSGDLEADMKIFQEFYEGVRPKYPEKAGKVALRPKV